MDSWPSSFWSRSSCLDPDNLAGIASGAELIVDKLSAGSKASFVRQAQSPQRWGLDLAELHSRLRADGALRSGIVGILLALRGDDSTICGIPLRAGSVIMLAAGAPFEANIHPGAKYAAAVLPADHWARLQALATGMSPAPMRESAAAALIDPRRAGLLARSAVSAVDVMSGASTAQAAGDVFDDYVAAVLEAHAASVVQHDAIDRTYRRRLKQAHSARDFVFAYLGEPISMSRLCVAIGVSRRQLDYAFRDAFGTSPREFIHLRRLNEIRRTLLGGGGNEHSVTAVALEHGITHFGRFAIAYRTLFGESPSETLRAARKRR